MQRGKYKYLNDFIESECNVSVVVGFMCYIQLKVGRINDLYV